MQYFRKFSTKKVNIGNIVLALKPGEVGYYLQQTVLVTILPYLISQELYCTFEPISTPPCGRVIGAFFLCGIPCRPNPLVSITQIFFFLKQRVSKCQFPHYLPFLQYYLVLPPLPLFLSHCSNQFEVFHTTLKSVCPYFFHSIEICLGAAIIDSLKSMLAERCVFDRRRRSALFMFFIRISIENDEAFDL